jgi:hypothetical protein
LGLLTERARGSGKKSENWTICQKLKTCPTTIPKRNNLRLLCFGELALLEGFSDRSAMDIGNDGEKDPASSGGASVIVAKAKAS